MCGEAAADPLLACVLTGLGVSSLSAASAAVQVTPTDLIPPAAPTGLTAVPGDGQVTLSWTPNSETDLASYRVLRDGTAVATDGGVKVDIDAPEGVVVETVGRDDARVGRAGAPVDRVAAQAYSAFEQAGVSRILAEPTLTAISGEAANFTAGGEIPVPTSQSCSAVLASNSSSCSGGIEYKP